MFWQAVQLVGVKLIFLGRLLILARLLAPDDFGLLAIAAVALDFLLDLTNLGLQPALVQRRELGREHYDAAWSAGVARALVVGGGVALAAPLIAELFAEPRATNVIRLLALRPLLQAVESVRVVDLTRELRFRAVALLRLSGALTGALVSIALAPRLGVWALVLGTLAGPTVQSSISYFVAPFLPRPRIGREAIRSLIGFGRWVFMAGVISMVGRSILQVAISRRLGAADLGLYFLAAKLAFLPSEVAGEVFGSVAFPLFSRLHAQGRRTARAFRALLTGISALLVPALALILVLAPRIVAVLGPQWDGAAPVIRVLALASLIGLLSEAAVPLFKGLGRPQMMTALELAQYGVVSLLVWKLAGSHGLVGAASAWIPGSLIAQILCVIFLFRVLRRPFEGLSASMLTIAVASGAGGLVALGVDRWVPGAVGLIAAGFAAAVVVAALLWTSERRFDLGLSGALSRAYPQVAVWFGLSSGRS